MDYKLKELEDKLPKNCCSFCTHMSLIGPKEDFTYDVKCIILDTLPILNSSCQYFQAEHSHLSTNDLDNKYVSFLEACLKIDYKDYKDSIYWQIIKEKTITEFDNECYICHKNDNLDVYHLKKNLGRESLKDLIVLCNVCSSI